MSEQETTKKEMGPKRIKFFIDKEPFETAERQLSVRSLLVDFAKEDPQTTTLALKDGYEYRKYGDLNELVTMKSGMRFVVFHNDPTPVS